MAEPNPANVAPWYFRNINQALYTLGELSSAMHTFGHPGEGIIGRFLVSFTEGIAASCTRSITRSSVSFIGQRY